MRRRKHTSPSDPRIVSRYTTVIVPFSENITSRTSPHHPVRNIESGLQFKEDIQKEIEAKGQTRGVKAQHAIGLVPAAIKQDQVRSDRLIYQ